MQCGLQWLMRIATLALAKFSVNEISRGTLDVMRLMTAYKANEITLLDAHIA